MNIANVYKVNKQKEFCSSINLLGSLIFNKNQFILYNRQRRAVTAPHDPDQQLLDDTYDEC